VALSRLGGTGLPQIQSARVRSTEIHLAPYLDTSEINSTFSRILSASMAKPWVQRVAEHPDVRLTATLWQGFTHEGPASAEERGLRT
jgi:uncharacterized protein YecE (DUF72 family)